MWLRQVMTDNVETGWPHLGFGREGRTGTLLLGRSTTLFEMHMGWQPRKRAFVSKPSSSHAVCAEQPCMCASLSLCFCVPLHFRCAFTVQQTSRARRLLAGCCRCYVWHQHSLQLPPANECMRGASRRKKTGGIKWDGKNVRGRGV